MHQQFDVDPMIIRDTIEHDLPQRIGIRKRMVLTEPS